MTNHVKASSRPTLSEVPFSTDASSKKLSDACVSALVHVLHSDTAASAWVVPCEGVIPSQIELVGSIARLFPKVLSDRLPIAGPGGPTVTIRVREDGWEQGRSDGITRQGFTN